ncbi:MAG: hypothetical protein STSR0007_01400 [Thermovirga sp.]
MIHGKVPETAEHERIVGLVLVGVDNPNPVLVVKQLPKTLPNLTYYKEVSETKSLVII